ncbi:MAG: M20/M25/M40 family metallo-hydrolase, partial [Acetobacteraceae bacterium]|nr:M20/M25/M40 family metallo-hydrolase [Acetobacteraceae bacterium]
VLGQYVERFDLEVSVSGEPFLTAPGAEVEKLRSAIAAATGVAPRLDTGGGTSDARFIAKYCKVAEFGLVGATMHQADERVVLADLALLTETYRSVLTAFLG